MVFLIKWGKQMSENANLFKRLGERKDIYLMTVFKMIITRKHYVTDRQFNFLMEFMSTGNQTQSYLTIYGGSYQNAKSGASRLMKQINFRVMWILHVYLMTASDGAINANYTYLKVYGNDDWLDNLLATKGLRFIDKWK